MTKVEVDQIAEKPSEANKSQISKEATKIKPIQEAQKPKEIQIVQIPNKITKNDKENE